MVFIFNFVNEIFCISFVFDVAASDHAIYSLISYNDSLICGGNKKLSCYPWADLISKVSLFCDIIVCTFKILRPWYK